MYYLYEKYLSKDAQETNNSSYLLENVGIEHMRGNKETFLCTLIKIKTHEYLSYSIK